MEQTIKLSSNFFLFQKHQNLQIRFFPLCFRSPRFGNSSELWQIQKSVACLSDCTSNRSQTFANWIFILCKDNLIIALKSERSEQRKKTRRRNTYPNWMTFFPSERAHTADEKVVIKATCFPLCYFSLQSQHLAYLMVYDVYIFFCCSPKNRAPWCSQNKLLFFVESERNRRFTSCQYAHYAI